MATPASGALQAAGTHRRGLALVAGAAIVWSSGGLLARMIETDVWTTVLWRSAFAALFLFCFILWRDRERSFELFRGMGVPGLTVAVCFAGASSCFVIALKLTAVAEVVVFVSTVPFLSALLGWLLMRERVRPRALLAMAAALIGIVIMVSNSAVKGALLGDLFAFVSACLFSLAAVTVRRHRGVRMTPAVCLATVLAALVALPLSHPLSAAQSDFLFLFLFGAGQLGIGLALFTTGARHVPAAEAALMSVLETILGPLWVWLALGEDPGLHGLVGGGLVVTALAVHIGLDLRQRLPPPIV